jgi:hypothetical protein
MEGDGAPPLRKDQLLQVFRHPEYLAAIGGQLTPNNVLDYFRYSSYYEQSCNNAILQMQNTADLSYMLTWDPFRLEQELKRFIGLEYVVVHAKPPDLFVIHQRWRSSPSQTKVLECYYVLNGNIHMAADIYSILGSKLVCAEREIRREFVKGLSLIFVLGFFAADDGISFELKLVAGQRDTDDVQSSRRPRLENSRRSRSKQ